MNGSFYESRAHLFRPSRNIGRTLFLFLLLLLLLFSPRHPLVAFRASLQEKENFPPFPLPSLSLSVLFLPFPFSRYEKVDSSHPRIFTPSTVQRYGSMARHFSYSETNLHELCEHVSRIIKDISGSV